MRFFQKFIDKFGRDLWFAGACWQKLDSSPEVAFLFLREFSLETPASKFAKRFAYRLAGGFRSLTGGGHDIIRNGECGAHRDLQYPTRTNN
jgi:hypothetical protein